MEWKFSHLDWEGQADSKKQTNKQTHTKMFHEIIVRFGLPRSLQSHNGTSFTSKVTQGVSKTLGITYYLHSVWKPQSSGKVERANQFLKSTIKEVTQETSPDGRRLYQWLSSAHVLLLRNRLVLALGGGGLVAKLCLTLVTPWTLD